MSEHEFFYEPSPENPEPKETDPKKKSVSLQVVNELYQKDNQLKELFERSNRLADQEFAKNLMIKAVQERAVSISLVAQLKFVNSQINDLETDLSNDLTDLPDYEKSLTLAAALGIFLVELIALGVIFNEQTASNYESINFLMKTVGQAFEAIPDEATTLIAVLCYAVLLLSQLSVINSLRLNQVRYNKKKYGDPATKRELHKLQLKRQELLDEAKEALELQGEWLENQAVNNLLDEIDSDSDEAETLQFPVKKLNIR